MVFIDSAAFVTGPKCGAGLVDSIGPGPWELVNGLVDPLLLCQVGQLSAHHHVIRDARVGSGSELEKVSKEGLLHFLVIGRGSGPVSSNGLSLVSTVDINFGDEGALPTMFPPVAFLWRFLLGVWALFLISAQRTWDNACKFREKMEEGKDNQAVDPDFPETELDSDVSVIEYE